MEGFHYELVARVPSLSIIIHSEKFVVFVVVADS
jgi:hypothetical protein